jgi:hypothetical protein
VVERLPSKQKALNLKTVAQKKKKKSRAEGKKPNYFSSAATISFFFPEMHLPLVSLS